MDNLKPSIEKLATDLHTVRKPASLQSSLLHLTFSIIYVSSVASLLCSRLCLFTTDKTGAGRGEETADSVTRRTQVGATGGAEGGNTHTLWTFNLIPMNKIRFYNPELLNLTWFVLI